MAQICQFVFGGFCDIFYKKNLVFIDFTDNDREIHCLFGNRGTDKQKTDPVIETRICFLLYMVSDI